METYVILATLTDKGRQDIAGIAARRQKNIDELRRNGINIIADYALLGEYDFLYIVEAPDNATIMRQVVKDAGSGTLVFRTLTALPMDQFVALATSARQNEG